LFRIFQELFNNSIQHSKAASISIIVKVENDELVFEYIDDGIGFDKNDLNFKEGSGLNSIRERADIIHVKMQVESIKNVMTKTVLCLDLKSIENGKN
jgi:signal transduction histidine kinase